VQCSNEITITIINMGRKFRGGLGPHLTQSRLGWGLSPCHVPSWSIQPFDHNKHAPKIGGLRPLFRGGGAGSPSDTKSPGLRPTSIPNGNLIYAAIWPQRIWAENWGPMCPLEGWELGPHLTQCGRSEAYLHAKFHLDPSNRLAAIHQRHRQDRTGQDRQTDRQTTVR